MPGLDVVATCAACFGRLKHTQHFAQQSDENRAHLEQIIEREYKAEATVYNLLQVMTSNDDIMEALREGITQTLGGLKVACYYGCIMVRPTEVMQFDDDENPQSMDKILRLVGAEPIDWAFKTECCGASLQVTEPSAGKTMDEKILHDAEINGADAIAVACPLCQLNVDMRQKEVNQRTGSNYQLPVYYFTELLALCLGASAKEVGIDKHYVPALTCAKNTLKTHEEMEAEAAAKAAAEEAAAKAEKEAKALARKQAKAKAAAEAEAEAGEAESEIKTEESEPKEQSTPKDEEVSS